MLPLSLLVVLASVSMFGADPGRHHDGRSRQHVAVEPGTRTEAEGGSSRSTPPERTHWHFIPNEMFARNGLTLKEMTAPQREAAHALLKTGSEPARLHDGDDDHEPRDDPARDRERQPVRRAIPNSISSRCSARPSAGGTWGWRVEGHHVSLHFTIVNGAVSVSTPTFFGTNPAEVATATRRACGCSGSRKTRPARC